MLLAVCVSMLLAVCVSMFLAVCVSMLIDWELQHSSVCLSTGSSTADTEGKARDKKRGDIKFGATASLGSQQV